MRSNKLVELLLLLAIAIVLLLIALPESQPGQSLRALKPGSLGDEQRRAAEVPVSPGEVAALFLPPLRPRIVTVAPETPAPALPSPKPGILVLTGTVIDSTGTTHYYFKISQSGRIMRLTPGRPDPDGWVIEIENDKEFILSRGGERFAVPKK